MYTIEDRIMEHVQQYDEHKLMGTRDAILALELPDKNDAPTNMTGNFYLSCLSIISKLQKRVQELESK